MPLTIDKISRLDTWNRIICPVCGGNDFVSLNHTSVWCNDCNAELEARYTAGDRGYVVDCFTKECHKVTYLETGKTVDYKEMAAKRIPEGYAYLIDKEGDYYSGWMCVSKSSGLVYINQGSLNTLDNTKPITLLPEEKALYDNFSHEYLSCTAVELVKSGDRGVFLYQELPDGVERDDFYYYLMSPLSEILQASGFYVIEGERQIGIFLNLENLKTDEKYLAKIVKQITPIIKDVNKCDWNMNIENANNCRQGGESL